MHLSVFAGMTSKIVQFPVYDSSSAVGATLAGLAFGTSGLTCYYNREGASGAATVVTLVTATKGTWTSSGFVAVDGTNMQGWYELHIPNAAIASGAKSVAIQLDGAANMVPVNILIELTAVDNQDGVRNGLSALPNVASGSAGAIPTTGTGSNQISVSSGLVTLAGVTHTGAVIPTVTTTTTATNLTNAPTSGDLTATMKTSVENAVWDAARSSHAGTGVMGQLGLGILRDNTATAGASTSITLDAGASTVADYYKGAIIALYSGTGAGQAPRTITAYSTGRVATIAPAWAVNPDSTSKFLILAFDDPPFVGADGRVLVTSDAHTAGETVAAVTGAVGSVTGTVASVTGNVGGNVTGSVGSVTAAVLIQSPVRKNVAISNFTFQMYDTTGALKTGLTVTPTVKIDAGSFAATTNAVTEIANGTYVINLAAADVNGNVISLRFSASGAVDTDVTLFMQP
jgi:hypothetical protein